jgi:hypothetical protein
MQSGTRPYDRNTPMTPSAEPTGPLTKSQKLRQVGVDYLELLLDYKYLMVAGAVLFGTSLVLPLVPTGFGASAFCNATMLCTHGTTPWGTVTSVFLYDGWSNILLYFIILVMYIAFSDRVDSGERRRRARFGSVAIFGVATIANALWLHFVPMAYSWGSSGVVYALWGFLLAFTLFDGMPRNPKSLDPRTWYASKQERGSAMGNLMVFSMTAIMLVSGPSAFLSSGPGVNVFAHGVSFLGGYFSANVYRWTKGRGLPAGMFKEPVTDDIV